LQDGKIEMHDGRNSQRRPNDRDPDDGRACATPLPMNPRAKALKARTKRLSIAVARGVRGENEMLMDESRQLRCHPAIPKLQGSPNTYSA
jgi:hypothetical protein